MVLCVNASHRALPLASLLLISSSEICGDPASRMVGKAGSSAVCAVRRRFRHRLCHRRLLLRGEAWAPFPTSLSPTGLAPAAAPASPMRPTAMRSTASEPRAPTANPWLPAPRAPPPAALPPAQEASCRSRSPQEAGCRQSRPPAAMRARRHQFRPPFDSLRVRTIVTYLPLLSSLTQPSLIGRRIHTWGPVRERA